MSINEHPFPCLSVVVPCHNEEQTIRELRAYVLESAWVAEVVAVDDGSTDGTFDQIRDVVIQDADLEYDPAEYGVMHSSLWPRILAGR